MNQKTIFKVLSLVGLALGGIGTLLTGALCFCRGRFP